MEKHSTVDELINMNIEAFRNRFNCSFYSEYIQNIVDTNKKKHTMAMTDYYLDNLTTDHELCRQSICLEMQNSDSMQDDKLKELFCADMFDYICAKMKFWDAECTDHEIINMFQAISYNLAYYCFIIRDIRKKIGIKIGYFN